MTLMAPTAELFRQSRPAAVTRQCSNGAAESRGTPAGNSRVPGRSWSESCGLAGLPGRCFRCSRGDDADAARPATPRQYWCVVVATSRRYCVAICCRVLFPHRCWMPRSRSIPFTAWCASAGRLAVAPADCPDSPHMGQQGPSSCGWQRQKGQKRLAPGRRRAAKPTQGRPTSAQSSGECCGGRSWRAQFPRFQRFKMAASPDECLPAF